MPLPLLPTEELDLVRLDRQGLLSRLQTLALQADPSWTDFTLNYPENVILEAQALLLSMGFSSINERARQLSLALVTDRLACIRLTKPFGFEMTGATAAQVDGYFSMASGSAAAKVIEIPAGTRLRIGEDTYTTLSDMDISTGNIDSSTNTAENAETETEVFASDGVANIILQCSQSSYIDDTVSISASNGAYTNTDASGRTWKSFREMGPDDRGFIPMVDSNGILYIAFGDGVNGAIPQGTITVTYKVGGGESGRVEADANWQVLDQIYDEDGNPAQVIFTNPAKSTGGYDAMTVAEARIRAPIARRTIHSATINEDFESAATGVAGIARGALVTSEQWASMSEDVAYLYLVAYGTPYSDSGYYPPATPTTAQVSAVEALFEEGAEYPSLMGVALSVFAATFQSITVSVRIYKDSGYSAADVKANITTALQKFFAVADDDRAPNLLVDFGYKLLGADGEPDYKVGWSKVLNAINDAEGVREISYAANNLLLNGSRQSVVLQPYYFPLLSTITVYDEDQGGVAI